MATIQWWANQESEKASQSVLAGLRVFEANRFTSAVLKPIPNVIDFVNGRKLFFSRSYVFSRVREDY